MKDPEHYYFDSETVEREPYMAPGLVTPEKAARGKLPTDVWWHTIVSPTGREKTGYPTQKPRGCPSADRRRFLAARRLVPRSFAGSGTLGAVARKLGRHFVLIDSSAEAVAIACARLETTKAA